MFACPVIPLVPSANPRYSLSVRTGYANVVVNSLGNQVLASRLEGSGRPPSRALLVDLKYHPQ